MEHEGSKTAHAAEQKPEPQAFIVTLRFQFPAWDEKHGIQFRTSGASRSEAISRARRQAYDDGHLCGGKGRVTFSAREET